MYSGVVPVFYMAVQATVDKLPSVPIPSFRFEGPMALLDAFSRTYLLCNLIPPMVLQHTSPAIKENPWTLLLTSLVRFSQYSIVRPYMLKNRSPAHRERRFLLHQPLLVLPAVRTDADDPHRVPSIRLDHDRPLVCAPHHRALLIPHALATVLGGRAPRCVRLAWDGRR